MKSLKALIHSWLSAGVILCLSLAAVLYLNGIVLIDPSTHPTSLYQFIGITAIFAIPSTILNWLYDKQGHVQTQRVWMKSPNSLFGKVGYILTGSLALWSMLFLGLILAALVIGGLMSLGQAAWST